MNIVEDQSLFDDKQEEFITELVRTVKHTLKQQGLDDQDVYDLTGSLVFNVSALIDGSATSGELKNPTVSYLAFREKEETLNSIITSPIGSYLHEISEGFVDNEFA
jgi:hypothetical protein